MTENSDINILIVDDDKSVIISLSEYLKDFGFHVICVESGEEGLTALKNKYFDVAIVDLRLPGITGETFILKAKKINPEMNFFLYTGSTSFKIPESLKNIGIDAHKIFYKPIRELSIFVDAIAQIFSDK